MSKPIIQLGDFRRAMKALGYTVRIATFSGFAKAKVFHGKIQINAANCHPPDHFERHRAFYDWTASHSIRDGDFIVIP